MLTRRDFGLVVAGTSLAALTGVRAQSPKSGSGAAKPAFKSTSTFAGITIGCNTRTFNYVALDDVIPSMALLGFGAAELHPWHVEPHFGGLQSFGSKSVDPAAQANVDRYSREALRKWRLAVPPEVYARIGRTIRDAGIDLQAHNQQYLDDVSDEEIERSFEMTKALGVSLITAVGAVSVLRRLDPFAQRHKIRIGMHNDINIKTIPEFEAARAGLSDYVGYTLDIGHFTAWGGDPLAMLKKNHDRVFALHLKDRKVNNGPAVAFGQGDTPLAAVLRWIRDNRFSVPSNLEDESPGFNRLEAARAALDYCRKVLLS